MPSLEKFQVQKDNLPQTGNVIIHLDSHPDLLIPSPNNWILKEACEGFFSTFVWIKPPWSKRVKDGCFTLTVGKDGSGEIGVCSNIPLFISTCTYKSVNELSNPKEITLEVVTFGKYLIDKTAKDDVIGFMDRIKEKFPENQRCFLNIDLDFFSTCNPYEKIYDKVGLYAQLIELYCYGINENLPEQEVLECLEIRKSQLNDLQELWKHVAEKGVDCDPPNPGDWWEEIKPIAGKLLATYPEIDPQLIHVAGCSYDEDDRPLVAHVTDRADITKLIETTFSALIKALPERPAAITIPMLDTNFCPEKDVEFIYKQLIPAIEARFGILIDERLI